jgi:hypothetical protein
MILDRPLLRKRRGDGQYHLSDPVIGCTYFFCAEDSQQMAEILRRGASASASASASQADSLRAISSVQESGRTLAMSSTAITPDEIMDESERTWRHGEEYMVAGDVRVQVDRRESHRQPSPPLTPARGPRCVVSGCDDSRSISAILSNTPMFPVRASRVVVCCPLGCSRGSTRKQVGDETTRRDERQVQDGLVEMVDKIKRELNFSMTRRRRGLLFSYFLATFQFLLSIAHYPPPA